MRRTSLDRIELLSTSTKMKTLRSIVSTTITDHSAHTQIYGPPQDQYSESADQGGPFQQVSRTSVSIAKGGSQLSGGIILHIPYFLPSGAIFRMYSIGSLNSSSVGRKVGASGNACGLTRFTGSRTALGWPRRSTVVRSKGAAHRALRGAVGA